MKIAVCYSGMIRNFEKYIDTHINHLISKYDCDVYFSFWDIYGFGNCLSKPNHNEGLFINESVKENIINKLQPIDFEFENYKKMDSFFEEKGLHYTLPNSFRPPYVKNTYSMYYKIDRSLKMVKKETNYDLILRLRPDSIFTSDFVFPEPKKNTLYYSLRYSWEESGGNKIMSDQFVFGEPNSMNLYHDVSKNIEKVFEDRFNKGIPFTSPEHLLTSEIKNRHISTEWIDIPYIQEIELLTEETVLKIRNGQIEDLKDLKYK